MIQIWTPCYDDKDMLEGAIKSTKEYNTIHYVVDGRYATFDGEHDTTPGAKDLCTSYDHVEYTHPPDLPIGDPDQPNEFRSPQHEQAKWVYYELLDQDEWAMEMDTDERLVKMSLESVEHLDETYKWSPKVLTTEGEQLLPAIRLLKPKYHTCWIDDVLFWREHYPRDTTLKDLCLAHASTAHRNTNYGGVIEDIVIRNKGQERPEEYQMRRADQLETMGVELAAQAVRDGKQPSTLDLEEEYDA